MFITSSRRSTPRDAARQEERVADGLRFVSQGSIDRGSGLSQNCDSPIVKSMRAADFETGELAMQRRARNA
ncbi:hypothetical protein, partial [Mesorhizobium sp. M1C.F.Ca.ET.212.01.1.1]|uniref:hypothetical protein n=1 Tax=Mesorhizobium sp. M1C.F.Ca.ET.212.01.1.1 TaxID=2500527 RepID=UPI001AEF2DB7